MQEIIEKLKKRLRVKSEDAEDEISDLIDAGKRELEIAGVYGEISDPVYYQATVLYCKAHFGYDEESERFRKAFNSLKDSMALSGDYQKGESDE